MSEVKIELMQFTNRPNGLEYSYRVYTESAALARKINHSLKWNPLTSKYTQYTTGDEPYLYISDTLTTPEELQTIIDNFNKVIEVKLMEATFTYDEGNFFNYEVYTDLDTALRIKEELSWTPASAKHCVFKPKTQTLGKLDHLAIYGTITTPDELQQIVNSL